MNFSATLLKSRLLLLGTLFALLGAMVLADSPIIRMARLSIVEGDVSYRRANQEQNNWYDASPNTPLGENDQVYTGQRGRTEIQLSGRNIVRLDAESSFKIAQFTTAVTQVALPVGDATFRIESLDRRQFDIVDARDTTTNDPLYFEVNTPTVAVTLLKTGTYRITVREDGTTEINVRSGEAEVYNQELGTVVVRRGNRMVIPGSTPGGYQMVRLQERDSFDHWSEQRDNELAIQAESLSARYVPSGIPGVYDLDRYGDWVYSAEYGNVWSPRGLGSGWAPYRAGYWNWYSDWGWTWVSTEPWGWAPYHYGRWAYLQNRWCWVPRSTGAGVSVGFSWSPALVTFFGWGNTGYNNSYNNGYRQGYRDARYDYVGWIPLAPGEHYYNPYRRGGNTTIINNTVINTRIDNYRNYNVPGGMTRLEGRHFDTNRVGVINNVDRTPIQQPALRSAVTVRGDSFRPAGPGPAPVNIAADPTNRSATQRQVVSRQALRGGEFITPGNAPARRSAAVPTFRSTDIPPSSDRTIRPGQTSREAREAVVPNQTKVTPEASRPNRATGNITDREYRRADRPAAVPSPTPTAPPATNTDRTIRPPRTDGNPTRSENTPSNTPASRRVETERRVESHQEAPREYRREEHPSPPRETRAADRPASPPPAAAPPAHQTEKPSAPARSSEPHQTDRTERPARDTNNGKRSQ